MTPQKPEQLGVCSWSMLPQSPQHMAEIMQELGLKKLQLGLVPHRDDAGIVDGVPDALAAVGAKVVSGMFGTVGEDYSTLETIRITGGIVPDEHWDENQRIASGAAARAKEFGLPAVQFHAGFLPHDMENTEFKKLAERIEVVAGTFAEQGVELIFETGQETADDLNAFFDHLYGRGVNNVGVNFDPANMILYDKGEPIEALRELLPRVRSIHIKDAVRTQTPGEWGQEMVVGEGEVDWIAFMRVLVEGDYTGDMYIEREWGDNRVDDAKTAIEVVMRAMAEAS
ncbi:MAG: sugar phosphate isomerase/epimerase family protein [Candidatus Latescibacterota bacterium]|nr:sugar phosphate isomerase/epimerase family protein [Candidatus Latescibacterota bacterium]